MKSAVISLLFAGLTVAVPLSGSLPQSAGPRTRDIYVSVVDGKGVAVPGLGSTDFSVREDGVEREVINAVAATEPLSIVLLVDDSQASTASIAHLRDGITHFLELMKGKASIGIVTVGERPTSVVERTSDVAAQKKAIGRIFARPGSGAYLLDGIVEVSQGLRKRDASRAHIVALSVEAIEFSNLQKEKVLTELFAAGATLHVLAIGAPAFPSSDEMRNRAIVIADGTEQTGGRREQLLTPMAIDDHLTRLAGELLNQYVVTYGRPESLLKPEKVKVSARKPGLNARARTRLQDR
ncbi:MAG TPA: hypothetical protein VNJ03_05930 [Vicinamibacterales bacterium]|nr:hypothetical protein [Vicinamibacterales bacterium]